MQDHWTSLVCFAGFAILRDEKGTSLVESQDCESCEAEKPTTYI